MAELRSFIFIDRLQPQTMSYLGTWIKGALPRAASKAVEAPASKLRSLAESTEAAERSAIVAALDATNGNKVAAAHILGISRAALYQKLEMLGLARAKRV